MYTIDEFVVRAPPEAHSQDVMSNHHQLMLNRLSFELVERQRSVSPATCPNGRSRYSCAILTIVGFARFPLG